MQRYNRAQRRYTVRFLTAMSVYVVALIASRHMLAASGPTGAVLVALAVLPALPLVAAIAVMGLYLREEQDEYVRAQLVHAIVIATGFTLAFCTVWGFLEDGGVLPHEPAFLVFPL